MIDDILTAIPLGFFLSFMIGPVFFVLLETSILKGFRAALALDLGVIVADIIFICIAYLSSFQLLERLSNQPGLFIFGGTILWVYGLITFLKRDKKIETLEPIALKKNDYINLFFKGFFLNFINIGVLLFWLGLIIIFGANLNMELNRIYVFFGTIILTYLATDILKIILAKQLKNKLTPRAVIRLKKILGVLLIICGLVLTAKGFLPKEQLAIPKTLQQNIQQ